MNVGMGSTAELLKDFVCFVLDSEKGMRTVDFESKR